MIRHVAGIAEIVDDLDAAVRLYREALGLAVEPKPGGGYAEVKVAGVLHFGLWERAHAARSIGVWPETLGWMVVDGPRLVAEGRQVNPPRLVPERTLRAAAPPARPDAPQRSRRSSGGRR